MIHRNLLSKLRKANKQRKLALALQNGFDTVEAFQVHLEKNLEPMPIKKVESKGKVTIYNITLLDATGSMHGGKFFNSKKGISKELETLQSTEEYTIKHRLFVMFDSSNMLTEYTNVEEFPPAKGRNTPLWGSIIKLLDILDPLADKKNTKVLIKIYTDGDNNTLHNLITSCARRIKQLQKKNFTITFVGTVYDMNHIIHALQLDESNTLAVENTEDGYEHAFKMSYQGTERFVVNTVSGEDVSTGFYKGL